MYLGVIADENPRKLDPPLSFLDNGVADVAEIDRDGRRAEFDRDPYDIVIETRDMKRATGSPFRSGAAAARLSASGRTSSGHFARVDRSRHCHWPRLWTEGARRRSLRPAKAGAGGEVAHMKVVSFAAGAGFNAGAAVGAVALAEIWAFYW